MLNDELLTITDVQDFLKCKEAVARKVMAEVGVIRIGRLVRIRRRELEWWIRRKQRQHERVSPLVKSLADRIVGAA